MRISKIVKCIEDTIVNVAKATRIGIKAGVVEMKALSREAQDETKAGQGAG